MYIPTPEAVKEYPFQRRVARWHYVTSNIFMKFYGKNTTNEILALDNYDEIMRRIADKNEKIVFIVPPDAAAYVPLKPARDPDETVFDYKFFFSEGKYPPTGS